MSEQWKPEISVAERWGSEATLSPTLDSLVAPDPYTWLGRHGPAQVLAHQSRQRVEVAAIVRLVRSVLTSANGQPAVAMFLRRPGDTAYRAFAMDVLRISDGLIAEITSFDEEPFPGVWPPGHAR